MRPIDADRLKAVLEKNFGHTGGASVLEQLIDEQPTIEPSTNCSEIPNSSDTISRQAVIDALDCINGVEEVLRSLPSVQPELTDEQVAEYCKRRCLHIVTDDFFHTAQPEPHEGHWIRTDCGLDVECKCSRCGYKDFVEPRDEYWFKRNYCPNCGAKMRGERQK